MAGRSALQAKKLLELDAVAGVAVGKMAFVDDAAGAIDVGTRAAGEIRGHAKGHGKRRADPQRQRTAHEKAGAGNVRGFRSKFWLG